MVLGDLFGAYTRTRSSSNRSIFQGQTCNQMNTTTNKDHSTGDPLRDLIEATSKRVLIGASAETKKRYVAVCDILGFKDVVANEDLQSIKLKYVSLIHAALFKVGKNARSGRAYLKSSPNDDIGFAVFSDTILLWSAAFRDDPHGTEAPLNAMLFFNAIGEVMKESIHNLPMRCGIAFGDVIIDKEIGLFLGQPIIDAHLTETEQDWVGSGCHISCHRAPGFSAVCEHLFVVYDNIPVKPAGHKKMFTVLWFDENVNFDRTIEWFMKRRDKSETTIRRKYNEALNFFLRWCKVEERLDTVRWFVPNEEGTIVERRGIQR